MDCNISINLLTEYRLICNLNKNCKDCPLGPRNNKIGLGCDTLLRRRPKEFVNLIQKCSDEIHIQKTYLDDMKEKFPNSCKDAIIYRICPASLYGKDAIKCDSYVFDEECCEKCWNQPIK